MKIKVSVNDKAVDKSLDKWLEQSMIAAGKALGIVGLEIEVEARKNASGPVVKSGNHVPWGGEGPNVRSGWLRRNIKAGRPVRQGFSTYTQEVYSMAVYARAVELGTGRTGKYPYMTPAFAKVKKTAQSTFNRAYTKFRSR